MKYALLSELMLVVLICAGCAPVYKVSPEEKAFLEEARRYVESGGWPDRIVADRHTRLSLAASKGYLEAARFLVEHGAALKEPELLEPSISVLDPNTLIPDIMPQTLDPNFTKWHEYPLCEAVMGGHLEMVKFLVEHGAEVQSKEIGLLTSTPLHLAASMGNIPIIRFLLDHGADIDRERATGYYSYGGDTALCMAAKGKDRQTIQFLVERGADVNAGRLLPINVAIDNGNDELARWLIDKGSDCGHRDKSIPNAITSAVRQGNDGLVNYMIRHGANVFDVAREDILAAKGPMAELLSASGADANAIRLFDAVEKSGLKDVAAVLSQGLHRSAVTEALGHAMTKPDFDAAQLLVEHGADANSWFSCYWPESPAPLLEIAAKMKDTRFLDLLLRAGARPDRPLDRSGWTALFYASSPEATEKLIHAGANPNTRDHDGKTALFYASSPEAAEKLIDAGADPNARDHDGRAAFGSASISKVLIRHGVSVNAADNYGGTPLHLAARWRDIEWVKLLLAAGAKVDAKDKAGTTPLLAMLPADDPSLDWMNGPERRESPEKVVDALVGAGADVNARDDGGMTPLMRAAMSHSWTGNRANPLVAVLVGKGANLSDRDKLGRTALHFASYSGDYDTVVFLHLRGMNLSAGDDMGLTPLHYAVLNVRSYRVYMYIQEESGAAEQARKEKHRALIEFLVSKADINAADKRGNTALHYADAMAAAERQSIYPPPVITFWKDKYQDVVGILKAAGARDDMKNKDGLTPAVLAGTPGK